MAVTRADIESATKPELVSSVERLRQSVRRYKEKAKEGLEDFMTVGIEAGAAFGIGWWIGKIKADPEFAEEDLQWWGIDKELWIGIGALIVGLAGWGGARLVNGVKAVGRGVLAYWAGSQGEALAIEGGGE